MPQGHEEVSERLQLQAKLLRQIAIQQRLKQAQRFELCIGVRSECRYNHDDIALEILVELMDLLPKALRDGEFQSICVNGKHRNTGFLDSELAIPSDAQLIFRNVFADIISTAERPYQPIGLPLTAAQLRTELASLISQRNHMLAAYPGKSIAGMLYDLSQAGKGLFDA